jgi:hypothetical protein
MRGVKGLEPVGFEFLYNPEIYFKMYQTFVKEKQAYRKSFWSKKSLNIPKL